MLPRPASCRNLCKAWGEERGEEGRTSVARVSTEKKGGEGVAFLSSFFFFHSEGVKSVGYNLLKNIPARTRPVEERIARILAKIILRISQLLRYNRGKA